MFTEFCQLIRGTANVSVVGVRTPQKLNLGCLTPTILVCRVTCNWHLNCTTGVFGSFCCYFYLRMHRNRLAASLCVHPDPLTGFKGWDSGKGKEENAREGRRMDTPNFWNVAAPVQLIRYLSYHHRQLLQTLLVNSSLLISTPILLSYLLVLRLANFTWI